MCPIHRVAPYPEVRAASIVAAGGIQAAATPTLQLAPNAGDYTLTPVISPATLTTIDPLTGLQGLSALPPTFPMQPTIALPRPVPVSYTQLVQASDLNATLTNVQPLAPMQPTVSHTASLPIATPGASSLGVLTPLPSSVVTSSDRPEVVSSAEPSTTVPTPSNITPATSWLVDRMMAMCLYFILKKSFSVAAFFVFTWNFLL